MSKLLHDAARNGSVVLENLIAGQCRIRSGTSSFLLEPGQIQDVMAPPINWSKSAVKNSNIASLLTQRHVRIKA